MILLIFLLFVFYAAIEGMREGWYLHCKNKIQWPENREHKLFALQRGIVILSMAGLTAALTTFLQGNLMFLSLCLAFPFVHESVYYETRHALDDLVYLKGWKDSTTTSNAKFNFSFNQRVVMFIAGVAIMVVCLFLK